MPETKQSFIVDSQGTRKKIINLIESPRTPLSPVQQSIKESAQKLGLTPEEAEIFARGRK